MKKRPDGRYSAQVYLGMKDGKKKYKTFYGTTQKEVKEKVAQIKIKMGKGIDVTSANNSFKLWADIYIIKKESSGLTAAYIVALKTRIAHLEPLYHIPISMVTISDVQDVIFKLANWHDGKRPLGKRTIGSIREVAGQIFDTAIISRVLDFNPAKYVVVPKDAKTKKREALTNEQQQWIIDTPHRAQCAAMVMMLAGLRRGELTALTWDDINFEQATIRVDKAVEFIKGKPNIKPPKTAAGDRLINIPTLLLDYLQKQPQPHMHLVYAADGSMLTISAWKRLWESYMHDLNVKYGYNNQASKHNPKGTEMLINKFTMHQLRHTFATMLYLSGTRELEAMAQLGHADIATTLGIYSHLDKDHKQKSVSKLNDYLAERYVSQ